MESKKVVWARFSDENHYRDAVNFDNCGNCSNVLKHTEERHNTVANILRCGKLNRDFVVGKSKVCDSHNR